MKSLSRTLLSLQWLCLFSVLSSFCVCSMALELPKEIEQTQQKIQQLDKLEADQSNKQLNEVYQQILSLLQEQQGYIEKTNSLNQQTKEHAAKRLELKQSLEKASIPPAVPSFGGGKLEELNRMMESMSSERIALQNHLDETQNRLAQLQARLLPAQNELSEAKKSLEALGKDSKITAASLDGNLADALALKRKKAYDARAAQIQYLGVELLSIPNQIELVGLQKEVLSQKLKNLNKDLERIQARAQELRQAESESIIGESLELRKAAREDPALEWLADENVALGNMLANFSEREEAILDRRSAIEGRAKRIEQGYTLLKQDLDLGGETEGVGELMRQTLKQLKSLGEENVSGTIAEIQKAQIQSLNYERQRNEISDKTAFLQAVVERFPDSQLSVADQEMRSRLNALLDLRHNLIGKLLERNQQTLREGSLLLNAQNQFNDQYRRFDKLLKENLLWTATNSPMTPAWVVDSFSKVHWSVLSDMTAGLAVLFRRASAPLAVLSLAYALFFYFVRFYFGPRFRVWREAANETVGRVRNDAFRNSLLSLAGELFCSLPAPFFLLGVGRIVIRLGTDELGAQFLGEGLRIAAVGLLAAGWLRRLAKPNGLLRRHLHWPQALAKSLHREMALARFPILLTAFAYVTEMHVNDMFWYELGRLAFLGGSLTIALMARDVTQAWRSSLGDENGSLWNIAKSPYLFGALFASVEILLAVMEIFGFHLGAFVLQGRILRSLACWLVLVLGYQLLKRWLLVEQRRLAYARAVALRAEMIAASGADGGDESVLENKRRELEQVESISLQSKTLLKLLIGAAFLIATGWIWSDLIPAFRLLDQVVLWEAAAKGPGGATINTITLESLVLVFATWGLVTLASRNLPAMIQLLVLPHLNLARGNDFAVVTVIKYSVLLAGLVVTCRLLGLQWEELQWLVAALSVGLGFGLQEIFANFISGLIILFEKPVRIGDIVTLGNGVTGVVDAVNTRATTMTDFDNKEIVIPNKVLITEQLTNWSLSSPVIRVVIPVGVAYGSDTNLVVTLLARVADEHPLVLDKPEKMILFREFGQSSLNFELRCFVSNPSIRLGVIHDLNMRIEKLFDEQNIEIAFPQIDVHIKDASHV